MVRKLQSNFIFSSVAHFNNSSGSPIVLNTITTSTISVCTGFPDDWIRVRTETEFPVDLGTKITVSCGEGYINTGNKLVACNTYLYQDFQYERKPSCNLSKFLIKTASNDSVIRDITEHR